MSVLKTVDLTQIFGGLAALTDVSIDIQKGELVGLIGPNGAGKTTLFNLITGEYVPSAGDIFLEVDGELKKINGLNPYKISQYGVARTFQNIRLFKNLTVLDNVKIAMNQNIHYGSLSAIFRTKKYYDEEDKANQLADELLQDVGLLDQKYQLAKNLPYGAQRKIEIARALATKPTILFLDEPAAGMNPQETKELTEFIRYIRDKFDLTIVLIEHDMSLVMNVCERIYVLNYGRLIAEGEPDVIQNDPKVIAAYLGEEDDD